MKSILPVKRVRHAWFIMAAAIVSFIFITPIFADTVVMRDGRRIKGRIVTQSRSYVIIRTNRGVRTYSKQRIRRIIYSGRRSAAADRRKQTEERRRRARARAARKKRERLRKEKLEREKRAREKRAAEERKRREEAARKAAAEKARREREAAEKARLEAKRKQEAERAKAAALARAEAERKRAERLKRERLAREQAEREARTARTAARVESRGALAARGKQDRVERERRERALRAKALAEKRAAALRRAAEEKRRREIAEATPRLDALWRSALLPGWGHLHHDSRWSGWGAAGLFIASAAGAGVARHAVNTARSDYNSSTFNNLFIAQFLGVSTSSDSDTLLNNALLYSTLLDSSAGESYRASLRTYRAALGFAVFVYLAQAVHAWWSAPPAGSLKGIAAGESPMGAEMILAYEPEPGLRNAESPAEKFQLGIRIRF